jgi:hypothetical protein
MPLNQQFNSVPSVVNSYDAVDVLSGTGITNMYAGEVCSSGAAVDYILSNNRFYSNAVSTGNLTGTDAAFTQKFDIDFDVLVNIPLTMKGLISVNIPAKIGTSGGSAGCSAQAYVVVKLRKWNGTTETEICQNTTKQFYAPYGSTALYDISAVYLDIPETVFAPGEYIRLTCIGYANKTQDGTYTFAMGYDPMNRSVGWDAAGSPSSLIFQMPQRIDL